jgi:hypothetical protein
MGSCCGSREAEKTNTSDAPQRRVHAPHKLAACGRGGASLSGACCEECGGKKKSSLRGQAPAAPAGQQRDPFVQALLDRRFGHAFDRVSVVTDERAVETAQTFSLNRRVLTPGGSAPDGAGSRKRRRAARAAEGLQLTADVSVVHHAPTQKAAFLSESGEAADVGRGEDIVRLAQGDAGTGATPTPAPTQAPPSPVPAQAPPACTFSITYANIRNTGCPAGSCGAGITFDVTRVTATGSSCPSLNGLRVTETVTTDNGCGPGTVTTGSGCTIGAGGVIPPGCTDVYSICGPAGAFPAAGCTEIYTQRLSVGGTLAETRTITFRITRTGAGCSGTATRS